MAQHEAAPINRRSDRPRRVAILGASLDVGNRGVMALATSLVQLIRRRWPEAELSFHYEHHASSTKHLQLAGESCEITVRNCRWSPTSVPSQHVLYIVLLAALYRLGIRGPARRNPWLAALLRADFVGDIRGGDSFSDIYGARRFLMGSMPLVSVALLGRPYTMLPQTYGPFRWTASRWLAGRLLEGASLVLTRDRGSDAIVRELSGQAPLYCPDVAFLLGAEQRRAANAAGASSDPESDCVIGLNVSGLLYMGGYTGRNMFGLRTNYRDLVEALGEALLQRTPATLLIVPHVFGSEQEEEACGALFRNLNERYAGRVRLVQGQCNERELKWIIGTTQMFIGSRMHACIAALSQHVPCVGLAYSDKFDGIFSEAGVRQLVVDLRNTSDTDAIGAVLAAFGARRDLRRELESRIPMTKTAILHRFAEILPTADGSA
jgi:colanic acid/amylovoran biosynthesis protein